MVDPDKQSGAWLQLEGRQYTPTSRRGVLGIAVDAVISAIHWPE